MKLKYALFVALTAGLLFNACAGDDNGPSDPGNNPPDDINSVFPGAVGSAFFYKTDTTNAQTNATAEIGSREARFIGTTQIQGAEYTLQENKLFYGDDFQSTDTLIMRRSETAIYYYVDTTGLGDIFQFAKDTLSVLIPDSLQQQFGIDISQLQLSLSSNEINFYSNQTSNWTVFNAGLSLGIFNFNLVDIKATKMGEESVELPLNSGTQNVTAQKVKYTLTVPDLEQIDENFNPLGTLPTTSYDAYGWFASNIGLVKLEGAAIAIQLINGSGIDIDLDDDGDDDSFDISSDAIITDVLTSYDIK